MNILRFELTQWQHDILKPLFEELNEYGTSGIAAQIYPDGIVAKVMHGEKAKALSTALGGSMEACRTSAEHLRTYKNK